jgi:hypothetical protein
MMSEYTVTWVGRDVENLKHEQTLAMKFKEGTARENIEAYVLPGVDGYEPKIHKFTLWCTDETGVGYCANFKRSGSCWVKDRSDNLLGSSMASTLAGCLITFVFLVLPLVAISTAVAYHWMHR